MRKCQLSVLRDREMQMAIMENKVLLTPKLPCVVMTYDILKNFLTGMSLRFLCSCFWTRLTQSCLDVVVIGRVNNGFSVWCCVLVKIIQDYILCWVWWSMTIILALWETVESQVQTQLRQFSNVVKSCLKKWGVRMEFSEKVLGSIPSNEKDTRLHIRMTVME